MAFVYEKIREEDKEWVDFERFKDFKGNSFIANRFTKWVVDRDNKTALIPVDSFGTQKEEGYEIWFFGFLSNQKYINLSVKHKEIKEPDNSSIQKWYDFSFEPQINTVDDLFVQKLKEAFIAFIKRNRINAFNYLLEL